MNPDGINDHKQRTVRNMGKPCITCGKNTNIYCDRCKRGICEHHRMKLPGYWKDGEFKDKIQNNRDYCPQCEPRATTR